MSLLVRDTRTKAGELSYKEIATEMSVGHRTVDGYREAIFQKLDIHTRIGLVMYAVKNGIVEV